MRVAEPTGWLQSACSAGSRNASSGQGSGAPDAIVATPFATAAVWQQRIALVTGAFDRSIDGVALTLNRLVAHLVREGHEVMVIVPATGDHPFALLTCTAKVQLVSGGRSKSVYCGEHGQSRVWFHAESCPSLSHANAADRIRSASQARRILS